MTAKLPLIHRFWNPQFAEKGRILSFLITDLGNILIAGIFNWAAEMQYQKDLGINN